jgi:hypothetical protein
LQKQVELNQKQREDLQHLKSSSRKHELEETQKQIKLGVAKKKLKNQKSSRLKSRTSKIGTKKSNSPGKVD